MVIVAVVVLLDSLELELDEAYPDGDGGGGVLLLDGDFERLRLIVHKISSALAGHGVGGRSLTGSKVLIRCSRYF